jgi:hypothetical protein
MYRGTLVPAIEGEVMIVKQAEYVVERVQTGVRMEKRLLKVLKAFAELKDMTLGDLLEGIVLHAFDGKCPFEHESLQRIEQLKKFYGLQLDARASHHLQERHLATKAKRPRLQPRPRTAPKAAKS